MSCVHADCADPLGHVHAEDLKPLHVKVAEALGWGFTADGLSVISPEGGRWALNKGTIDPIPRFDTDWSATGPLVEKYRATLNPAPRGGAWHRDSTYIPDDQWTCWDANVWPERLHGHGETPIIAVCNLILALKEAGKL